MKTTCGTSLNVPCDGTGSTRLCPRVPSGSVSPSEDLGDPTGFSTDAWAGPLVMLVTQTSFDEANKNTHFLSRGSARQHSASWLLYYITAMDQSDGSMWAVRYLCSRCSEYCVLQYCVFYHLHRDLITVKPRGWHHDQNLIGEFVQGRRTGEVWSRSQPEAQISTFWSDSFTTNTRTRRSCQVVSIGGTAALSAGGRCHAANDR